MPKVFISHSSSDKGFTNLLAKLLDFHHIDPWYDSSGILPGSKISVEIEEALNSSESLIAVVSKSALQSDWVKREVVYFQANKPGSIIPLLLDDTSPSDFYKLTPGFEQYQAVNFNVCMLTGFQSLMAYFDKEFLPDFDRRDKVDRRGEVGRRQSGDRRKSLIDQRMRIGFWKKYQNATGIGKFDLLGMTLNDRFKIINALKSEIDKYSYATQGEIQEPEKILEEAVNHAPERLRGVNMGYKAIYVIEAIVEFILETYEVDTIVRRDQGSRRNQINRRGDS